MSFSEVETELLVNDWEESVLCECVIPSVEMLPSEVLGALVLRTPSTGIGVVIIALHTEHSLFPRYRSSCLQRL